MNITYRRSLFLCPAQLAAVGCLAGATIIPSGNKGVSNY